MIGLFSNRKRFSDLTEAEILGLAISAEEDDSRIYATYAARLREEFPATAKIFDEMTEEENEHRRRLIDEFERRFDGPIPLIRREHVAGFYARRPAAGGANTLRPCKIASVTSNGAAQQTLIWMAMPGWFSKM